MTLCWALFRACSAEAPGCVRKPVHWKIKARLVIEVKQKSAPQICGYAEFGKVTISAALQNLRT